MLLQPPYRIWKTSLKREGELRAKHVPDGKAKTLQSEVRANVAKSAHLKTDEDRAFLGLEADYHHKTVKERQ